MGFDPKARCKSDCQPAPDQSLAGFYFVTLCTYKRRCLFGDMVDGELQLSKFGACVESAWREIPACHSNVRLDAFVIMPNHLHGIVSLNGTADDFDNRPVVAADEQASNRFPLMREIVHVFKARCAFYLETNGYSESMPIWQRNHHQHLIADEKAYLDIVQYIENEPQQWQRDVYNARRGGAIFRAPLAMHLRSPSSVSYG